jgi:hypothetical protein
LVLHDALARRRPGAVKMSAKTERFRISGPRCASANDPIAPEFDHVRLVSKLANSAWVLASLLSLAYVTWYAQLS